MHRTGLCPRGEEAGPLTLRRHVSTAAASAASTEEFFARLDQAGALIRLRYSTKDPGQVTGYAVALPGDTTRNGEPVWYGGGTLAADLSWPKLAQRWTRPARPDSPLTPDEADALWEYAARTAADATADQVLHRDWEPGHRRRAGPAQLPQPAPASPTRTGPARPRPAPAATATSATAAAATGTHPLTSTEAYSCSAARSRSGAAPREILVPHVPGSARPGRGHPRGSHRSSSRWYRRYHQDPGVLSAVLRAC